MILPGPERPDPVGRGTALVESPKMMLGFAASADDEPDAIREEPEGWLACLVPSTGRQSAAKGKSALDLLPNVSFDASVDGPVTSLFGAELVCADIEDDPDDPPATGFCVVAAPPRNQLGAFAENVTDALDDGKSTCGVGWVS